MLKKGIFILFTLILTAVTVNFAYSQQQVQAPQKGPYLMIKDGNGEITLAWTSRSSDPVEVAYGTNTSYGSTAQSVAVTIFEGGDYNEYRHTSDFTNLSPGTKYFYMVTVEGIIFTGSFVTPDPEATSLKFVVFSDPQDGGGELEKNLPAEYINTLYQTDPAYQTFAVCAGDVANTQEDYYSTFFSGMSSNPDVAVRVMLRNLFFSTAKGNHDYWDMDYNVYTDYFNSLFPYAIGRQYYSYDYGPAHISVLDAYNSLTSGSDQINWLENDLANTNKPWKFIIVHEPGYKPEVDENDAYNSYVRTVIQPLCKKYNVAMVIAGHWHVYSRAVVTAQDGPKVRHIITSSIGPTNRDVTDDDVDYIVHAEGEIRNILKINIIDDHTLECAPVYTYGSSYGEEFDVFTIHRPYDVEVTSNTGSAATISWKSAVPGRDTVLWGTSIDMINATPNYAYGEEISTDHSVVLTGLVPEREYWYRVMTNGECSDYKSFTAEVVSPADEPTLQASNIQISNIGSASMTINWTAGNGNASLVVMRSSSQVTTEPVDQSIYDADTHFGEGSAIGTGNYVVYNGSGTTVTVAGLNSSTEYHVAVFTCNVTVPYSQNYLTDNPARGSATTYIGAPVATAATEREGTGFRANWNEVTAAQGYRLDVSEEETFNSFVSGFVNLDVGNVTSRQVSGLTAGIPYYYRLRAYSGETSDYSNTVTVLPLSSPPGSQASSVIFDEISTHSMTVSWTKGNADYSLVLIRAGSAVDSDPVNGMSYVANPELRRGSQLGSGNYVVYNGAGESVRVTGLTPGVNYHVAVYSFNGSNSSEHYLLSPAPARNNTQTKVMPPYYYSVKSGNWESADTWVCSLDGGDTRFTPDTGPVDGPGDYRIHIIDDHEITVNSSLIINFVEVGEETNLIIQPGVTITTTDEGYGLYVAGTATNYGTLAGSGLIEFVRGSRYIHATTATTMPEASFSPGSTIVISGGNSLPQWNYPEGVNLEVSGDAKTIQPNQQVTIDGSLTTHNLLSIASTGNSSGSLIVHGTSTGNITYQRSIPDDGETQKWHYISAPVTPVELNSDKSIYSWDEVAGAWSGLQNIDEEIESGKGYTLIGGGSVSFIGTMVQSDLTIKASSPFAEPFDGKDYDERDYVTGRSYSSGYGGGGWNLLGNPYTSALSVSDIIAANYSIDNSESSFDPNYVALYLFDGDDYQYVTRDESGWNTTWPNGTYLNATHIQAGQGFFVLAMNDGAEFIFTRSMQEHRPAATLLKSAGNRSRWPGLALKVSDGTAERQTVVMLNETMTTGLDPMYDVGKMGLASGIDIYTALVEDNGVNFARQALSPYGYDNPVIPVGLECSEGGIINFSADVEPLRGFHYWLEDRETGVMTDLSSGGGYSVSVPQGTTGTGRFFMHISVWRPERQGIARSRDFPGIRVWAAGDQQVVIKGEVSEQTHCEVHTISGRKIYEKRLAGGDYNTITLTGTAKGVYLITVIDGEQRITQRVTLL